MCKNKSLLFNGICFLLIKSDKIICFGKTLMFSCFKFHLFSRKSNVMDKCTYYSMLKHFLRRCSLGEKHFLFCLFKKLYGRNWECHNKRTQPFPSTQRKEGGGGLLRTETTKIRVKPALASQTEAINLLNLQSNSQLQNTTLNTYSK